jgi:hypothetical protein
MRFKTFKWPIQRLSVSIADDLQRCLGWSTALAAPQPDKRSVLTTDDLFLALLTQDNPARDTLVSLGKDPSEMRTEVMRARPAPG